MVWSFVAVFGLFVPPGMLILTAEEATEPEDLAQFYGFSGVELFELNGRVNNMISGDFSHDLRSRALPSIPFGKHRIGFIN